MCYKMPCPASPHYRKCSANKAQALWTARPLASRTVCRVNVLAPSKFNLHCPSGPAAKQGALGNTSSSNLQRDSTTHCTAMRPSIVRRMSLFSTSAVSRSGTRSFSLRVFLTCFALDFVLAAAFDVCFFLVFWGPVLRVTAPTLAWPLVIVGATCHRLICGTLLSTSADSGDNFTSTLPLPFAGNTPECSGPSPKNSMYIGSHRIIT